MSGSSARVTTLISTIRFHLRSISRSLDRTSFPIQSATFADTSTWSSITPSTPAGKSSSQADWTSGIATACRRVSISSSYSCRSAVNKAARTGRNGFPGTVAYFSTCPLPTVETMPRRSRFSSALRAPVAVRPASRAASVTLTAARVSWMSTLSNRTFDGTPSISSTGYRKTLRWIRGGRTMDLPTCYYINFQVNIIYGTKIVNGPPRPLLPVPGRSHAARCPSSPRWRSRHAPR